MKRHSSFPMTAWSAANASALIALTIAAALLPALLGALALPAPAQAQTTCTPNTGAGEFWCGVVTVGEVHTLGVPTADGFFEPQTTGDLSDKDFEIRGNSYTIDGITVGRTGTNGAEALSFNLDDSASDNEGVLTDEEEVILVLYIGSDEYKFSDATNPVGVPNQYVWSSTGLDWSSVTEVTLRLADLGPAAPASFTAGPGNAQVELSWTAPIAGITRHEYRYKTSGDYPATWTQIANSGVGGANEDGFTVTGLTNETAYTFQLRAVSVKNSTTLTGAAAEAGPVTPTPGICDRTQQVRDEILMQLSGVSDCAAVTVADLATVTALGMEAKSITSLEAGDFAGLTGVTHITLTTNQLGALPANLFSGLTSLKRIRLDDAGLTSLPANLFSGLTALTHIHLSDNESLGPLPANQFSGLTSLEVLQLDQVGMTMLLAGLFSDLTALTTLNLSGNGLSALPDGLFSDLTALTTLNLSGNGLSALPDGLFSDLTALTTLNLSGNELSALPDGLFSGLTALTSLNLSGNELSALPDGLFSGLTALTVLDLGDNPDAGDTLPLTVTLEKVGTDQVRAKVPAGAPFTVDIPVTLVDGELDGAATALAVAAGSVEGTAVTVTRAAGTSAAVTADVDLTTQPPLPSNHRGYEFASAASGLPVEILPQAEVTITRVAVTSSPGLTSPGGTTPDTYGADEDIEFSVTFSAAVEVTGDPQFGFSLAGARVADYDSGSGSVTLTFVYTVLPTDRDDNGIWVGNHATGNVTLQLDANDAITRLGGTDDANLEHTALEALPGHKVDGSRTAQDPAEPVEVTLHLSDGEVGEGADPVTVTATASPASADAFTVTVSAQAVAPATDGDFTLSTNRVLRFAENATASTGTVTIAPVDDGDPEPNQVVTVSGSASIADVIGPGDVTLTIRDDDLVRISGICNRTQRVEDRILQRLKYVHSFKGGCGDVNETHLAKVKFLGLRLNPSTERPFTLRLRSDDFKGLVNLEELDLADTRLSSLPSGVFAGLASLETLNLNKNRLRSLPAGVFDGLTSLVTLRLQQNPSLRSLPYDEFEALPNLRELRVDPEGRRGYQMAGSERDVELEVEPGRETTYQVRLTHRPTYSLTEQPTLTVSSDATEVVATPRTLRFTRENWFRRQTVRVVALASAAGTTATLSHTSVAVTMDRPIPTVTVLVMTGNSQRALTAQFASQPDQHDGSKRIKVRVVFSEAVDESPENVGEHGVDVEGGEVTSARPVDGNAPGGAARKGTRSAGGEVVWEFEIEPDSDGDVTVSLEAGRPCDEPGAICTADGRTLSTAISTTVRGPDEAAASEPPDKPTGLTATASHDRVVLTWDDPGDDSITGYVILRRIHGVDPQGHFDELVADTETAATTYTDDTVSAETRYTYRIKAINGAGTSERSRWFHIDIPAAPAPEEEQAAEPPDKPNGLEATVSNGQVVLTWDDPGDDSITGYVILRRVRENDTGGDFSVLVADTGSAATTYTDDTVAASTTYTYRIKAINEHGTSERSRWFHIDIPEAP